MDWPMLFAGSIMSVVNTCRRCAIPTSLLAIGLLASSAFAQTPEINSVQFTGSAGNYTLTIQGSGFGASTVSLPYQGDVSNFRVGDSATFDEWGYTGDADGLTYESWTDIEIVVEGFGGQPGDAILIALWNSTSQNGATWGGNIPTTGLPQITSVELSGTGQNLQIVVNGTGFGSAPASLPAPGDTNYLRFIDYSSHCGSSSSLFSAGFAGWGVLTPDSVTLDYASWSNTQIVISGFGGAYGTGCATYTDGDPIIIVVYNSADTSQTGLQTAWGGSAVLQPPPTSESITQPLNPTAPNVFSFDNDVHNFAVQYPPGASFSGVTMTVNAVQTLQTTFQQRVAGTPFATAVCIPYQGENDYCEDYQVTCMDESGNSVACPSESTPSIAVKTSYDTEQAIINPGFLMAPIGTNEWTNIFDSFYLQRIDPTTKGKTTGFSEFFAVSLGASNAQGAGQFTFLAPLQQSDNRIFPAGTLIPVEFQLASTAQPGQPVTDATAGITVTMVSDANGNPASKIIFEKSSPFRFEGTRYVHYLRTEGYAPGTYNITVYGNAFAAQQVQFTLPARTFGAHLKTQIQSLTFDSIASQYVATLTVTNIGRANANGVIVFWSALDFAFTSTMLPYSLGDIVPGGSATVTLTYPAVAGKPGHRAALWVVEAFAGGVVPVFIPTRLP